MDVATNHQRDRWLLPAVRGEKHEAYATGGADRKTPHAQASMVKLFCSEMTGRVADRAVQIFGGRG